MIDGPSIISCVNVNDAFKEVGAYLSITLNHVETQVANDKLKSLRFT